MYFAEKCMHKSKFSQTNSYDKTNMKVFVSSQCENHSWGLTSDGQFTSRFTNTINEPRHEKTNVLVFDLFRHKPGCTATEDD